MAASWPSLEMRRNRSSAAQPPPEPALFSESEIAAQIPVHVYSDDQHIWLQLRRDVPTEHDISRPSFKVALCLTPGTAHILGLELFNVAEHNKDKQKAQNPPARQPQPKPKQSPPNK